MTVVALLEDETAVVKTSDGYIPNKDRKPRRFASVLHALAWLDKHDRGAKRTKSDHVVADVVKL